MNEKEKNKEDHGSQMEQLKIRKSIVAGQFYPSQKAQLTQQIASFVQKKSVPEEAIACILPHAGYIYSGKVAVQTISQVKIKNKIILLGPNHTGYGKNFSIMTEGIWQTPMGEVKIDTNLAEAILKHSHYLKDDFLAHLYEHSLEVELPILQYFKTEFEIVPLVFLSEEVDILKEIGKEIASVIKDLGIKDSILLVASSDMTHYEPQAEAERKDKIAIEAILNLDEDKLNKEAEALNITMCGIAPVTVVLSASKALGAKSARLVAYQTSGDLTGDYDSVVGYAGIIIS